MIVKGKYKYSYSTINLKSQVANRFRHFSKKIAPSHSVTLQKIMDFFEWHGLTSFDEFEQNLLEEILNNRKRTEKSIKRTEAAIAIIRDIEITQTRPNNVMLLSLFGESIKQEKPIRREKKLIEKESSKNKKEIEITVPKIRYERLADKLNHTIRDFQHVLDNAKVVKKGFGKAYLKLEITENELEKYKQILRNTISGE
ncbi:MAG: BfmA/BtgA family mobilization protein [Bacteroidota bacterium]